MYIIVIVFHYLVLYIFSEYDFPYNDNVLSNYYYWRVGLKTDAIAINVIMYYLGCTKNIM